MLVDRFFFNCYNNIADLTKSMKELKNQNKLINIKNYILCLWIGFFLIAIITLQI